MSEVGSGIINIITESLYDNPIVVFREYVQNSVDSIFKSNNNIESDIKIFYENNCLYFADNGNGIEKDLFAEQMGRIANSNKVKTKNIGYKGIGRLSGLPYCDSLNFINIIDYKQNDFQTYCLDGKKYTEEKNSEDIQNLSVEDFLNMLSENSSKFLNLNNCVTIPSKVKEFYQKYNKGFLVIMENISAVLKNTINSDKFVTNLSWLLPVDFEPELYERDSQIGRIVSSLKANNEEGSATRSCNISYNNKKILRPIKRKDFRSTVFENDFEYAVGMITFNGQKIQIDKGNSFSGIKIYIDNMLLCDESELIPALDNYGLLTHSINGMIQTVRGIGAMIYITDKVNISANARRTFIEITDYDSLMFLNYLAEFVNDLYDVRYALSNYASALRNTAKDPQDIEKMKSRALTTLGKLVNNKVKIEEISLNNPMLELSESEKKAIIKKSITAKISKQLRDYLKQCDVDDMESCYEKFIEWLINNVER